MQKTYTSQRPAGVVTTVADDTLLPPAWPVGRDPAPKHCLRVTGNSVVVWVVFWVGGDLGSPHKSSHSQFHPVLRKSDQVPYVKVC